MNYLFERLSNLFSTKDSIDENDVIKELVSNIQLNELNNINQLLEDHYSK